MSKYPKPFSHDDFAAIPKVTPPKLPPRKTEKKKLNVSTNSGGVVRKQGLATCFARGLWMQQKNNVDISSPTFQNREPKLNRDISEDEHFHYVPGVDEVEFCWMVARPDLAKKVIFELWSITDDEEPIWSVEYQDGAAVSLLSSNDGTGPLDADIFHDIDDQRFPTEVPNLGHGPYQVRMIVHCQTGAITTAWTYFGIVVHSLELHWGPEALVPTDDVGDTLDFFNQHTKRDEKRLLAKLSETTTQIDSTTELKLPLPSTTAAYLNVIEWFGWRDMAYLRHKAKWGDGPRLPIIAKIKLSSVEGEAVDHEEGAPALAGAKFMWDWHDKTVDTRTQNARDLCQDSANYLIAAYRYKENADNEPPDCLNCHADRGGKRGSDKREFPVPPRSFPFTVAPCETRKWASLSTAAVDGDYKGCTGVIFQPSRMAMDSYKITVYPAVELDDGAPVLDCEDDHATLAQNNPGLVKAATGMMEVQRQIDARYVRKGTNTPPMPLDVIDETFAPAGMVIKWTQDLWTRNDYLAKIKDAFKCKTDNANDNPRQANKRHDYELAKRHASIRKINETDKWHFAFKDWDQWYGLPKETTPPTDPSDVQFRFPSKNAVLDPMIAAWTKVYINKGRISNDKKRMWNTFKGQNPDVDEETLLVRFYRERLNQNSRNKIDPWIKDVYKRGGWTYYDEADLQKWGNWNYGYSTYINLVKELHQLKIMADDFEGMTFFHYRNISETCDEDGTIRSQQFALGGLAAVGMSADYGYTAAFMVWEHPTNEQRERLKHAELRKRPKFKPSDLQSSDAVFMRGVDGAAHEFGHFMHLPHAAPTAESPLHASVHINGNPKNAPSQQACIMNYNKQDRHLCGACCLRARGWAFFKNDDDNLEGVHPGTPGNAGNPVNKIGGRMVPVLEKLYPDFT